MRRLTEQIQAASRVDFSSMSPSTFEDLVADLLGAVGFNLDDSHLARGVGIDFRATYQRTDPFGSPEIETWLVETKLYSSARVSVQTIRGLAGLVATTPGNVRGLLVTNGQLTSMALDVLADLSGRPSLRLQVIDGLDLRRLLRQFPAVAERHFAAEPADLRQEPDADS